MPARLKQWLSGGKARTQGSAGDAIHKIRFLNRVFAFAGIVAFGMGFIRIQSSLLMGLGDFVFALIAFGMLLQLKRRPDQVEQLGSLAIAACFLLFLAIYLFAPYNTTRISLFFLLLASAFFLKGRRTGLGWLAIILLAIWGGSALMPAGTGYSWVDLLTSSLYLIALLFIFDLYETFKEEQRTAQQETNAQLNTLIETLPDAIFLKDGAGRWQIANRTGLALFNLEGKPWQDKTDYELGCLIPGLAPAFAACTVSDEQAFSQKTLSLSEERVFQDGRAKDFEVRKFPRFTLDGERIGLVIIGRDVSERKGKDRLLEESELRFRSIFNQAAVGIALVAPDGRFGMVNDKFCTITGYSRSALLESTFQEITHPEDLLADVANVRQLLSGTIQTYAMEKRYLRPNGDIVWVNLNVSLIRDAEGQPQHFVSVIEDISVLKRLYREIAELGEEQLRRIGMELHDNLGQQLTGISLLMKSQQTALAKKGFSEAVETGRLVEYLNQAISSVRSMAHGLYAQDADRRGLATSLGRLVSQVTDLTGVRCVLDAPGELPEFKPEVVLHLYRIAQEAISNAIKHGKPTEVAVRLMLDKDGGLWLRVSNDLTGTALQPPTDMQEGVGLQLMRHRANLIGAMLVIDATPGVSMSIVVHLPPGNDVLVSNPLEIAD